VIRQAAFAAFAALACPAAVQAAGIEYRSLSEPAVMYDAPSKQARQQFVIARQTPVEVVRRQAGWVKVREPGGMLAWLEASALAPQRMIIVTAERARVLVAADDGAALVFEAERRVLLEPAGTCAGWVASREASRRPGRLHSHLPGVGALSRVYPQ
jgi:SH3-like domain-containing protein